MKSAEQAGPVDPRLRLHGLDHLRAAAIGYVFLYHYAILSPGQAAWLPGLVQFGWSGVDLFFVLSGFLISSQLFAQLRQGRAIAFRPFFLRRFFRIVPAYLVTVALCLLAPGFREQGSPLLLWKLLTFTQNFGLNVQETSAFSHAWSLCVEEHFYLLLPLAIIALQSKKVFAKAAWIVVGLFVLGLAIRAYSFHQWYRPHVESANSWVYWYKWIYFPTYCRLDGLLTGVAIAAFRAFRPVSWSRVSRYGNLLFVTSLPVISAAFFLCKEEHTFRASVFGFPLVAIGYGLLVMSAVSESSFLYRWKSRITALVATLSYAIYLTHKGIIRLTQQALSEMVANDRLLFCVCVATALLGAALLYRIVEKPFMQLRGRLFAKN